MNLFFSYSTLICGFCGVFRVVHDQNHGSDWITFYGEIPISAEVKVSGFKAAGLLVRVSLRILFTFEARCTRLTEDWMDFRISCH